MHIHQLAIIAWAFALPVCTASGQHLIDRTKEEVRETMKQERKDFLIDESSRNTIYNVLKYIDRLDRQTWLFVFNEADSCILSKRMCDYAVLSEVLDEMNNRYIRDSGHAWHYQTDNKHRYAVTLEQGRWYFTITIKRTKE